MGSKDEDELFAAWTYGHFGPTTFPGALERAKQHAFTYREGAMRAELHRGFARVRLSYVFGLGGDALVKPDGTDPVDELRFVSAVQLAVAGLPGALVLFNPSGELLLAPERLETSLREDPERIPVDAWTNVRKFALDDEWLMFDTPGMGQLDVVDHELVIPRAHPSCEEVPGLALSLCAYDAGARGVLGPGDTASDLAGGGWTAHAELDAVVSPPRPVLRWAPDDVDPPMPDQQT